MDWATIEGCLAKVRRSEELFKAFAVEWDAFLDTKPWPGRIEHDAQTGWYSVYFDFTTPPPPTLDVMIGELAHNLRSALDHLAWREAVEFLTREPNPSEGRRIAFPLREDPHGFRSAEVLRYVSKDAAALMERCQPYKCPNSDQAASLTALHWFNRVDKHRALQLTGAFAPSGDFRPNVFISFRRGSKIADLDPHLAPGQRLTGDTKILSVRFVPLGRDPQVSVQGKPPVTPGLGGLPAKYRGAQVHMSIDLVRQIVNDFTSLLP